MSPLLVITIPLALVVIGIVLNSLHIVHDQPHYSLEDDPAGKLAAERDANYHFFHLQRERMLQRQKRVGQYAWLVLAVFIASSWFLYVDAVKVTTAAKQISSIKTFALAESNDAVLSLTLNDGSNTEYRAPLPWRTGVSGKDELSKQDLRQRQLASLGFALNVGGENLPLGFAVKFTN
ncbi:MAG TPA: hypothetical protein VMT22_21580 [Terriglobales bacterium]|nr:hypothetical protein [Terriglobales bacterium]